MSNKFRHIIQQNRSRTTNEFKNNHQSIITSTLRQNFITNRLILLIDEILLFLFVAI